MTENELLAELAAELRLEPVRPDEITVQQLAAMSGKSDNAVRALLEGKVRARELTVRWASYSGGRVKAYSKAVQE